MNLKLYEGWQIYTYNRTISKQEQAIVRNRLKALFNYGDWCFSENTHRCVIFYGSDRQEINVYFREVEYGSDRDKDIEKYHVVFDAEFFGLRTYDERAHQELCRKVLAHLPWKKQGFWRKDGTHIPIPKFKMLRMR